jgi:hypothetical protein
MSLAAILKRLDAIEAKLNLDRKTGNWVRNLSGALVWDAWDMDAPPGHDPTPGILDQLHRIRERLQAEPGWKEPTEAQKADARSGIEEAFERIRSERQAIRDFTAHVEAELAKGVPLSGISDPPRS